MSIYLKLNWSGASFMSQWHVKYIWKLSDRKELFSNIEHPGLGYGLLYCHYLWTQSPVNVTLAFTN